MAREPKAFVLALDIGSSSTRAALFDERGKRIAGSAAAKEYSIRYTREGAAELDPLVVLKASRQCVAQAIRAAGKGRIIAISGSAFWHGLLALDRQDQPLTAIFTWADSRAAADAAALRSELSERTIQLRTGCMLRAPFWPAKLRWLKRTRPALLRRAARWVSPAGWVFQQLFGASGTSHSMASGTGLYDLQRRTWDVELCALCGVAIEKLGPVADVSPVRTGRFADADVFNAIGDGAASNLGSGANAAGKIAVNLGTSAAVRLVVPSRTPVRQVPHGFFRYVVNEERALVGGAVSNAGNLRRWCLRELRLGDKAEANRARSRTAAADDTLTILPFWVEERAPTWPEGLRGTIVGLTPETSAPEILRATQTSVFYRLAAILERLESASGRADEVIVSGGILRSPASLAILADCFARDIRVSDAMESSLRGAALYALEHLGLEAAPLARGRLIKHRPQLAAKHRTRREQQDALERGLSTSALSADHRSRGARRL